MKSPRRPALFRPQTAPTIIHQPPPLSPEQNNLFLYVHSASQGFLQAGRQQGFHRGIQPDRLPVVRRRPLVVPLFETRMPPLFPGLRELPVHLDRLSQIRLPSRKIPGSHPRVPPPSPAPDAPRVQPQRLRKVLLRLVAPLQGGPHPAPPLQPVRVVRRRQVPLRLLEVHCPVPPALLTPRAPVKPNVPQPGPGDGQPRRLLEIDLGRPAVRPRVHPVAHLIDGPLRPHLSPPVPPVP